MKILALAAFGAALTVCVGAASADPVENAGHQIAKGGRAVGHVVAATGRHVDHDMNGTSDNYNDHPGHAGYHHHYGWRHHHRHHHAN